MASEIRPDAGRENSARLGLANIVWIYVDALSRSVRLGARNWRYAVDPPESIPPADVRHASAAGAVASADELAAIFAAAAPPGTLPTDLGAKLVALCQTAHQRCPALALDDRELVTAIGMRAPTTTDAVDEYLARCHPGDLALALMACRGVEPAIAELERAHRLTIDSTCRRFATNAHSADDLKQILRERLVIAEPPKLADYAGQAFLDNWLRVTAVRIFLDLEKREDRVQPGDLAHDRDAVLEPGDRHLLRQHLVAGLSIDQLGAVLGVHRATVARRITRAREQLGARRLDRQPVRVDAAMMSCPDENALVLLSDGALADSRRASIEHHLDGCGACTLLVAELANMAAPVRPVPTRYRVIRQLGAGAMGVVWEAEDTSLGRRVALKFVRTTDGETTVEARRERRSRLVREARALAQLRHPNVVSVYDVGESADEMFLALELVIGTDARNWRTATRSSADVLGVWRQVAAGLAAVHRAGIVHRDIKPDNVLVADDGRVLLGDFGLATDRFAPPATNLTETGAIVGTPIYMAHEQLLGEPATQKSDQFALCVSIWEALVGTRPFVGPTLDAIAVAMQTRLEPPVAMRPHVFAALARGLDPDPARRWPTIDALLAALDGGTPKRTSRPLWLALGAALVAATATIAVLAWRDSSSAHASAVPVVSPPPAPTWTTIAPVEVATPTEREPPPPPVDWKRALDRATSKLAFGEAGACLDLLADIQAAPPTYDEQIKTLRATCMMKHGDCAGGRALFEAVARAHHWDEAHLAVRMRDADFAYCPLDAGPRERWAPRARYRLVIATGMKTSCKPVLAFMAKHDVTLADPHEQRMLESRCQLNAGDKHH